MVTSGDDPTVSREELPMGPPARRGLWSEVAVVVQPARLALAAPRLARAAGGDGLTVVLVPGWRAPESSMAPIAAFLRWRGFRTRHWGLGVNHGDVESDLERLLPIVRRAAAQAGRPVAIVGWSLGGVIAREVARSLPDTVQAVATFGTPVVGGPTHTLSAAFYGRDECERIAAVQRDLDANDPIRVPITAIYTRRDTSVDWRACIDRTSPDVTMVEVGSTHFGLGVDPDVWLAVANGLARVTPRN